MHVASQPSGCGAVGDKKLKAGGGQLHNQSAAQALRSKAEEQGQSIRPPWNEPCWLGALTQGQ